MAKSGGKKGHSLAQLAASLDTSKRPLPPELKVSEAEARALLKTGGGRAPLVSDAALRSTALGTLASMPPSKLPGKKGSPKAEAGIKVRLAPAERPDKSIEVRVAPEQLSVGGLFVRTSTPLKLGAKYLATLVLPPKSREVRLRGEIVRIERVESGDAGTALRFTEYLEGAEVALATEVVAPALRQFVTSYAEAHGFEASAEYVSHTVDVLAAWELLKAEREGAE